MSFTTAHISDEDFLNNPALYEEENNHPENQENIEEDVSSGSQEDLENNEENESTQNDGEFENDSEQDDDSFVSGSSESNEFSEEDEDPQDPEEPENKRSGSTAVDYKAEYEKVFQPFKANGKDMEVRSAEEVRQLMQMGANYTQKMQEIAPYRKVITMLQQNGLLDEQKLSYLIDLDKKRPEAIQHLVKSADIDPLDIDTTEDVNYTPGNYSVSDSEIQFKETLDSITAEPNGHSTVQLFNSWDPESKAKLWEHPQLMAIIHQQRQNGMYDRIVSEIDRLRTFGQIPPNVSFIEAYTRIGNELQSGNQQQARQPVARKAAVTSSTQLSNSRAARAASTPRGNKSASKTSYVNLSDDDFMKQFENVNY